MSTALQTLEDLRQSPDAAWLWDITRARLVWANAAGIAAFGAHSLFDLIDQPFDASESGLADLAAAMPALSREQPHKLDLAFPSQGQTEPLPCECRLHTLADGRNGVLTIWHKQQDQPQAQTYFDDLPAAGLALSSSGSILAANELARGLFDSATITSLHDLLTPAQQAETLLARLHKSKLVSGIAAYHSPFGQRELRINLRRLAESNKAFALAVIEDITERRELERKMIPAAEPVAPPIQKPATPLAAEDRQVFETLGKVISKAAAAPPRPEARPQQQIHSPAPTPLRGRDAGLEELRAILDICADGIVTMDEAGTVKTFSAGAEAIFGYRAAEVMGRPFAHFLADHSQRVFEDYLSGLAGRGLATVFNDGREVSGIVRQGGEVPLFLTLGRLTPEGKAPGYCAVLRDITSFKRSEAELRTAKEAAESASRHKSEFLARVSHELRTPLNAIMGFSDLMRMGRHGDIGNERYRGYLNDIHSSGLQLLSMINDLLDLSKIESGKLELNFTAVNLADVVNEAQRLLQDQATRARVVIRKSIAADLPRVVADQQAMQQVLVNLLSNAIKYTDAGGQVFVSAKLSGHGELALSLHDTGIGMSKAELAKALQPFMRIEKLGRERPGTGLGLPLAKAMAEANRASFAMSSEPGKGTLVEITFPTTRVLAE